MKLSLIFGIILFQLSILYVHATIPSQYSKRPSSWFHTEEGHRIVGNVISWQSIHGSWPKNKDTASTSHGGNKKEIRGTFDNGATIGELRFLSRAYSATEKPYILHAIETGVDHLLTAQYASGGWPQYYPLSNSYHRHITFNDNAMVRILEFLREVNESEDYSFLDSDRIARCEHAFEKGIRCILDSQVIVDGKRTVWCAQHDEKTLAPAKARSYELPSLSGGESAGILLLLMSLDHPTQEIRQAVKAGVAWYEAAMIKDVRYSKINGEPTLTKDASAPPLWARFYEIETNRPFFCDRDGIKKYKLAEIGEERRRGYSWYNYSGDRVAKAYASWEYR